MLQAALGLSIDAWTGAIDMADPVLPDGLERLLIRDLTVGDATVDLAIQRVDGRSVVIPRKARGQISVRTLR